MCLIVQKTHEGRSPPPLRVEIEKAFDHPLAGPPQQPGRRSTLSYPSGPRLNRRKALGESSTNLIPAGKDAVFPSEGQEVLPESIEQKAIGQRRGVARFERIPEIYNPIVENQGRIGAELNVNFAHANFLLTTAFSLTKKPYVWSEQLRLDINLLAWPAYYCQHVC
jgi:hypothetical protein